MPIFQNTQTLVGAELYFVGITAKSQYSKYTLRQQRKWKTITKKQGFFPPLPWAGLSSVCTYNQHMDRKQNYLLQENLTSFLWIFEGGGIKLCVGSGRAWISDCKIQM